MSNNALLHQSYEIIGGEKIKIMPNSLYNCKIMMDILYDIMSYCRPNRNAYAFYNGATVEFSEENVFKPDIIVVKKEHENIIDWRGSIHGAPDMIVEVISKATKKFDVTVKKDVYEAFGVEEYWVVDPFIKSVSVYILRDGKYELDDEYIYYLDDDYEFESFSEEEKSEVKSEITLSIFPELTIKLSDIFGWDY